MALRRGRGVAAINYPTGMTLGGDPSQALVHSTPTGAFMVTLSSVDLGQGLVRAGAASAEEIDGEITRRREEERLRMREPGGVFDAQQARIRFLHQIVVVGERGETFRQVGAQGRLMRLHVLGKPTGLFGGRHGAGRADAAGFRFRPPPLPCRAGSRSEPTP